MPMYNYTKGYYACQTLIVKIIYFFLFYDCIFTILIIYRQAEKIEDSMYRHGFQVHKTELRFQLLGRHKKAPQTQHFRNNISERLG